MMERRSTIGLALLCAFALCALAAQSAMAQVGTKSVNTTAVTCVFEGGNLDFADEHCGEKVANGTGKYGHVAIKNDATTEVEVSLVGSAKLLGTMAGVNTEITCNKVKSVEGKSFLHNVETSGKHTVTGTAQVNFTECTVHKPLKCRIKEPILTTADAVGVEGLNGKNEAGIEFIGEGAENTFSELSFENKSAEEKCSLLNGGKPFLSKGSAIATGKTPPGEKHGGATGVLEDANGMETLEIGLKKLSKYATGVTKMAGGGNPIAITRVT
jgi:hypothetical protein